MITTGTILDKQYDKNILVYIVSIDIFKTTTNSEFTKSNFISTCCASSGLFEPYKKGDIVYIGFVNHESSKPVILGKIYQNITDEHSGYYQIESLNVNNSTVLSKNTRIGDITYDDIKNMQIIIQNLQDRIKELEKKDN